MKSISKLSSILSSSLPWNKSRITLFSHLLVSLFAVRTVNLKQIANAVRGKAKADSNYRRLQRFFSSFDMCFDDISYFIVRLFFNEQAKWYLTMDRTNWKFGKANINILMLGICYKGRAIPVCWSILNKRGNSNTPERIDIVERFIRLFGKERILGLLADREFIGGDWFNWLNEEQIPFVIRVKKSEITTNSRGLEVDINGLFFHLKVNEEVYLKGARILWEQPVYLAAKRMSDGEFLIIASNYPRGNSIDIYKKRWEIETLFECFKGRGFNFEDTRITKEERINKMVAVLSIAYCWAHKTGEYRCEQGDGINLKKHGRLEKSIFRHGLDLLQQISIGSFCIPHIIGRCLNLLKKRPIKARIIELIII